MNEDDFVCDVCGSEEDTLYEGYFKSSAATNPWAAGTASAGLLQLKRVCEHCLEQLRPGSSAAEE